MERQRILRYSEIKRVDDQNRIVYGEVYVPFDPTTLQDFTKAEVNQRVDTYNTFMRSETLKQLSHKYMEFVRNVDVQHDRESRAGVPVESYIAREDDQVYLPGAWVMGVRVDDNEVWDKIKSGEITGYSIDVLARTIPTQVKVEGVYKQLGELIDITPFFVSLVDKAANKRTFEVIRCSQENEDMNKNKEKIAVEESAETQRQAVGLLHHIRKFFVGESLSEVQPIPSEKAPAIRGISLVDEFASREPWRQLDSVMMVLNNVWWDIRLLPLAERETEVRKAASELADIVSVIMSKFPEANGELRSESPISINEGKEDFGVVLRVGKKISKARLEKLREAVKGLMSILEETDDTQREDKSMANETKTEVAVVKTEEKPAEAKVDPIIALTEEIRAMNVRLSKVEGQAESKPVEEKNDDAALEEIRSALVSVADSIKGIGDRLEKVEKKRSASQQPAPEEKNDEPENKKRSVFSGVFKSHSIKSVVESSEE